MPISSLLSVIVLAAVLGLFIAIVVAGAVYARRVHRNGIEAVLAGARRHRELRG